MATHIYGYPGHLIVDQLLGEDGEAVDWLNSADDDDEMAERLLRFIYEHICVETVFKKMLRRMADEQNWYVDLHDD